MRLPLLSTYRCIKFNFSNIQEWICELPYNNNVSTAAAHCQIVGFYLSSCISSNVQDFCIRGTAIKGCICTVKSFTHIHLKNIISERNDGKSLDDLSHDSDWLIRPHVYEA